jgi:hypothetical protein
MSTTDAMVESSFAIPVSSSPLFDLSFDDFDDNEWGDDMLGGLGVDGDDLAIFPNDYRRSIVRQSSLVRERNSLTGSSPLRQSLIREKSLSPMHTTSRQSLSKRYGADHLSPAEGTRGSNSNSPYSFSSPFAMGEEDRGGGMLRESFRGRAKSTRRSLSSMGGGGTRFFLRPPSTRKKRIAIIEGGPIEGLGEGSSSSSATKDHIMTIAELEKDIKENPEAWIQGEKSTSLTGAAAIGSSPFSSMAVIEEGVENETAMEEQGNKRPSTLVKESFVDRRNSNSSETPRKGTAIDRKASSETTSKTESKDTSVDDDLSGELTNMKLRDSLTSLNHFPTEETKQSIPVPSTTRSSFSQKSTPTQSFSHGPPLPSSSSLTAVTDEKASAAEASKLGDASPNSGFRDSSQLKSQDSLLMKVDPYVGDVQYRNLSVLDNLELYFREQVFPASRPCYPDLYLRERPPSLSTTGSSSSSTMRQSSIGSKSADFSLKFIPSFAPEEKLITLFCEKVIDLKDRSVGGNSGSAGHEMRASFLDDVNDDGEEDGGGGAVTGGGGFFRRKSSLTGGSTAATISSSIAPLEGGEEQMIKEVDAVIILTDFGFYLIDSSEINPKVTFSEAPLFTTLCALPLYKLR